MRNRPASVILSSKVRNKSFGKTTWGDNSPVSLPIFGNKRGLTIQPNRPIILAESTLNRTPLHPALFTLSSAKLQKQQQIGKFSSFTIIQLALISAKKRQ